jgi:hypothetical protein
LRLRPQARKAVGASDVKGRLACDAQTVEDCMGRRKNEDDDDIEEPGLHVTKAPGWETETVSQKVQSVLDSLEITKIDPEVRKTLQRQLYRKDKYLGGGGRGEITLLLRTIVESEGNQDALIESIVSAVAMCMVPQWTNLGLAWIEAFDAQTDRDPANHAQPRFVQRAIDRSLPFDRAEE